MLTINPFAQIYQGVYDKLIAALPDTSFLRKAPFIVPYSPVTPQQFTITANVGDHIDIYINNNWVQNLIAISPRFTVGLLLVNSYNFVRIQTSSERYEILVASVNYATILGAWADQFYSEVQVRVDEIQAQLNSPWSLKQVEHQLVWQDLLPATPMMRVLAGKMAIKSIFNMAATDEGVLDIAKAVTGNTPIIVPTMLDDKLYEPECRLIYSSAHDFAGYEFNIWLFNLCATSWQAFITLCNNLDDSIVQLLSVTDRQVRLIANGVTEESHEFDFDNDGCSIVSILTDFFGCFSNIRVFVQQLTEANFDFCAYSYDNVVSNKPFGRRRFDMNLPFDQDPAIPLDSADVSDPYNDGYIGLQLCETSTNPLGDPLSGTGPVYPGNSCDDGQCKFQGPCVGALVTDLATIETAPLVMDMVPSLSITSGAEVWTTSTGDNTFSVFNSTNQILIFSRMQINWAPIGITLHNGFVWICCSGTNEVLKVDPHTKAVVATIATGIGTPTFVVGGGSNVFVTLPNSERIAVIDTTNNAITYITGVVQIEGITYNYDLDQVAVTRNQNTLSVYQVSSKALICERVNYSVGLWYQIAYGAGFFYALDILNTTIYIINAVTYSSFIVSTIGGAVPWYICFDRIKNLFYITTDTPAIYSMVPGIAYNPPLLVSNMGFAAGAVTSLGGNIWCAESTAQLFSYVPGPPLFIKELAPPMPMPIPLLSSFDGITVSTLV